MLKLQFLSVDLKPFVGNFLLDFFLILWTNGHEIETRTIQKHNSVIGKRLSLYSCKLLKIVFVN